jgi:AcrR family transcriptional regulator
LSNVNVLAGPPHPKRYARTIATSRRSPAPRQQRSSRSRAEVLAAATQLFIERGYAGTSVAAIGEAAGYSRGIVTKRFGSKEQLAWDVARHAGARWEQVLRSESTDSTRALERIRRFIHASRDSMSQDPTSRMVLERLIADSAGPMAPLHARFRRSLTQLESRLAATIEAGVLDGSVRPGLDATAVASVLIAQLRGIGYQWFLFPDDVDPLGAHAIIEAQVTSWLGSVTDPG